MWDLRIKTLEDFEQSGKNLTYILKGSLLKGSIILSIDYGKSKGRTKGFS